MTSWWAVEHWKAFARFLAARDGAHVACEHGDRAEVKRFQRATEQWESRLLALKTALDAIGPEQGLDPEAVHKLAGCARFDPLFLNGPEAGDVEAARGELCRLLTGTGDVSASLPLS